MVDLIREIVPGHVRNYGESDFASFRSLDIIGSDEMLKSAA
jgi:hypothetical protein